MKKAQLRELLTQYGPVEFIWFDTALGDGELDHEATAAFVKSLQPAVSSASIMASRRARFGWAKAGAPPPWTTPAARA